MSIRILFFASLADVAGMRETTIDAAGIKNVISAFDHFASRIPSMEKYRASILFALNSEFARPESPIRDGDELAFFPPVSGG
jgi:molybdopterin converting factor subunit 1